MAKSHKIYNNFFWRFLERSGAQIVTLIVSIVLARILDPSVYGTVAIVTVMMTILQVFVDGGLGNALIQKKDADDLDFSSVFFFNVFACAVMYLILFFSAPFIAAFYENNELVAIIRVLGLTIMISGVKGIQQAYVSKHFLFKKFFFSTLGGTICAAAIGIWMAVKGYGVWALVAQYLVNTFIDTAILWCTVNWRPKFIFSFPRLRVLLSFGWKIFASNLISVTYEELRALIIGKKYSAEDLAFFNKGKQFPNLIITNINTSIDSVLFPAMSEKQADVSEVRRLMRSAMKISSFVIWPMMIGLAACADSFVSLLLTDKWLPCVPFLQIMCFTFALYPIHTANLNAIKSLGKSDIYLKLEITKKIIGFVIIFITMWFGVFWMAIGQAIAALFSLIINIYPSKRLLGYSYHNQFFDLFPNLIISIVMGFCVYFIPFVPFLPHGIVLIAQIFIGIILYIVLSIVTKNENFIAVISLIKSYFKKGEQKR